MELASSLRLLPRYVYFVYPTIILLAISPLIQLAFFSHPSADDFCYGTIEKETLFEVISETLETILGTYRSWSGNYASVATQRLIPGFFDLTRWNAIIPLGLISLTFSGILYLVKSAFEDNRFTLPMVLIATCCTALFLVNMPNVPQGLYWFTAANEYHLGSILLLFYIAMLIRLLLLEDVVLFRSALFIGLVALLIVAAGVQVMTLISLLAIMLGLVIREFLYEGKQRYALMALLVLLLVLAYITVGAPGNFNRAQHFPDRGQFWFSVSGAVYWGMRSIIKWMGNPLLWVSTAIIIGCFTMLPARQIEKYRPNRVFIWLFPLVSISYLLVMHFPHLWATGIKPSGRVSNVIYFVFLLLWFWYAFICYRSLLAFGRPALSLPKFRYASGVSLSSLLMIFSVMVYVHPTMSLARLDLVGRAHSYHATNLERYRILREHQGTDTDPVIVPAYPGSVPKTIYFDNLTGNSGHFINTCTAQYFGVQSVVTAK